MESSSIYAEHVFAAAAREDWKLYCQKNSAGSRIKRFDAINREWKPLCVIEFEIEHMTGKEAIELVRTRQV